MLDLRMYVVLYSTYSAQYIETQYIETQSETQGIHNVVSSTSSRKDAPRGSLIRLRDLLLRRQTVNQRRAPASASAARVLDASPAALPLSAPRTRRCGHQPSAPLACTRRSPLRHEYRRCQRHASHPSARGRRRGLTAGIDSGQTCSTHARCTRHTVRRSACTHAIGHGDRYRSQVRAVCEPCVGLVGKARDPPVVDGQLPRGGNSRAGDH